MAFGLGKPARRQLPEITDEDVGWLGVGVEVEGNIKLISGLLRINSHVKGTIRSEGTILVNDQGDVEGEIHTKMISVSGKVKGTIHAADRIEIKEHGIVLGDIYTPSLVIDPGGYFDGQCHMPTPEPANEPSKKQPA